MAQARAKRNGRKPRWRSVPQWPTWRLVAVAFAVVAGVAGVVFGVAAGLAGYATVVAIAWLWPTPAAWGVDPLLVGDPDAGVPRAASFAGLVGRFGRAARWPFGPRLGFGDPGETTRQVLWALRPPVLSTSTVTVVNAGHGPAVDVQVAFPLPTGSVLAAVSDFGSVDPAAGDVVWPPFDLDAGESRDFTVTASAGRTGRRRPVAAGNPGGGAADSETVDVRVTVHSTSTPGPEVDHGRPEGFEAGCRCDPCSEAGSGERWVPSGAVSLRGQRSWWPPARLSSWAAAAGGALAAVLSTFVVGGGQRVPTAAAVALVGVVVAFRVVGRVVGALTQAIAAPGRFGERVVDAFRSVDHDGLAAVLVLLSAAAVPPAVTGLAVFAAVQGALSAGRCRPGLPVAVGPAVPAVMVTSSASDAAFGAGRYGVLAAIAAVVVTAAAAAVGVVPPLVGVAAVAVGPAVAATAAVLYRRVFLAAWAAYLDEAGQWENRWARAGVKGDPPFFVIERDAAGSAESLVREAVFQVADGTTVASFLSYAEPLITSLKTEAVLIKPAAGSIRVRKAALSVAWATTDLSESPHTDGALPPAAHALTVEAGFVAQFRGAKPKLLSATGEPPFMVGAPRLLSATGQPGLWATRWELPAGMTTDQLAKSVGQLQEGLGVPWVRVRRADPAGADQSTATVIVFGADPATVTLADEPGLVGVTGPPAGTSPDRQLLDRLEWDHRWASVNRMAVPAPTFVTQRHLPDSQNAEGPGLIQAWFDVPAGVPVGAYVGLEKALISALHDNLALVAPEPGEERRFSVTWAPVDLPASPHLSSGLSPAVRRFAVAVALKAAFAAASTASVAPTVRSVRDLTDNPAPAGGLIEAEVVLPPGMTFGEVSDPKFAAAAAASLGVGWVGFSDLSPTGSHDDSDPDGGERLVAVAFGSKAARVGCLDEADAVRLVGVVWAQAFRSAGIHDKSGRPPTLLTHSVENRTGGLAVSTMEFTVPAGRSVDDIRSTLPKVLPDAGAAFGVAEDGDRPGIFTLVAADKDPLDRLFTWADYVDQVMVPPGDQPQMGFYVGVGVDDRLVEYRFEAETPHLVVAGSSGKGKSNLIHSMLLQLLNKNTTDQLELWMAEPKNELQRYQCVPHVKRFIDMRSVGPDESIYDSLAEMLAALAEEMERRYALMDELPGRPQKLADMLVNPHLREPVPYIVCLIEECADYFAPPSLRDHRPAWEQVVFYGELLARKARAAGIFMVFATQRPTKQSIPANIKGQSRRIGFGTTTLIDSMVVIDQPGLETLTAPGRGMVTSDKHGYRQFRALYLPPEVTEDIALSLPDVQCLDPRARNFSRGAAQGLAGAAPPIPQGIWGDDHGTLGVARPGDPFETPYGPRSQ